MMTLIEFFEIGGVFSDVFRGLCPGKHFVLVVVVMLFEEDAVDMLLMLVGATGISQSPSPLVLRCPCMMSWSCLKTLSCFLSRVMVQLSSHNCPKDTKLE